MSHVPPTDASQWAGLVDLLLLVNTQNYTHHDIYELCTALVHSLTHAMSGRRPNDESIVRSPAGHDVIMTCLILEPVTSLLYSSEMIKRNSYITNIVTVIHHSVLYMYFCFTTTGI